MFQPTVGIVIPAYNRRTNLEFCLSVLPMQTLQDFVVVVADDGSTDGTRKYIGELRATEFWRERLIYVTGGPHRGGRTGRTRNIGVAALPPSVRLVMQLDTDILMVEHGLESFWKWHQRYPDAVLLPQIDWLPQMDESTIRRLLDGEGFGGLARAVPNQIATPVGTGSHVGYDLRILYNMPFSTDPQPVPLRSEWYLPGAMALSVDLYWKFGGYDEAIRGYGFEDLEFGTRMVHGGAQCLALSEVWTGHLWHPRAADTYPIVAQRNADYIIRKLQRMGLPAELITFYDIRCDWAHWWHYNRERGTTLVRVGQGDAAEIWAINRARTHRLQLPDLRWVKALGFSELEIIPTGAEALEGCKNVGVAHDPLGDGMDYLPPPRDSLE